MNPYLSESILIDTADPEILKLAERFSADSDNPRDTATGIYHYVRDQIRFSIVSPHLKASEIAADRRGDCYGKAKLQTALLRACGIEAGLIIQELTDNGMKHFFTAEAIRMLGRPLIHTLCAFKLGGNWIKADATFNSSLLDRLGFSDWAMARFWSGDCDIELDKLMLKRDLQGPLPALFTAADEPSVRSAEVCSILNSKLSSLGLI